MSDSSATPSPLAITCPHCGGPSTFEKSNVYRPFCGERCKLMDLGAWGDESFRVPAETPPQDMPISDPRLDD